MPGCLHCCLQYYLHALFDSTTYNANIVHLLYDPNNTNIATLTLLAILRRLMFPFPFLVQFGRELNCKLCINQQFQLCQLMQIRYSSKIPISQGIVYVDFKNSDNVRSPDIGHFYFIKIEANYKKWIFEFRIIV